MDKEKTPFTVQIIEGFVASIVVLFYFREQALLFVVAILIWLIFIRRNVAAIAGSLLISLATSPEQVRNTFEYLLLWLIIGALVVFELGFQLVHPLWRENRLDYSSVMETSFFYVLGVIISYAIQMSYCGVSLIQSGSFDLLNIQSQLILCENQQSSVLLLCFRCLFMSALTWGCLMVALRRVNFDLKEIASLPVLVIRALLGASLSLIIPVIFSAFITASQEHFSQSTMVILSYLYSVITVILASIGASVATMRVK